MKREILSKEEIEKLSRLEMFEEFREEITDEYQISNFYCWSEGIWLELWYDLKECLMKNWNATAYVDAEDDVYLKFINNDDDIQSIKFNEDDIYLFEQCSTVDEIMEEIKTDSDDLWNIFVRYLKGEMDNDE